MADLWPGWSARSCRNGMFCAASTARRQCGDQYRCRRDFWPWRHRPSSQMVKVCRSTGLVKPCTGSPSVLAAPVWGCLPLAGSSRRSSDSCTTGPVGGFH